MMSLPMLFSHKLPATIGTQCRRYCFKPIRRVNIKDLPLTPRREQPSTSALELTDQLKGRINTSGPITVAEYMREVLTNPSAGYYMNKDVLGREGDFITSPEIGQIFGELVAIWCYTEWMKIGAPKPFQIVELGPGRGTLTADILKVFSQLEKPETMSVNMVEVSQYLSKLQAQKLCCTHSDKISTGNHFREGLTISGVPIKWYQQIEDVPTGFSIVLAHEFFDALPIHKFQRDANNSWKEILIDVDPINANHFRFIQSRNETPMSKLFGMQYPNERRNHVEHSFEAQRIMNILAKRLEEHGGIGLIVDYGHSGEKSDTFRAFKSHKLHDPLKNPGSADLTADVDFSVLKQAAVKNDRLITFGPVEQGSFLRAMGGDVRLEVLKRNANEDQLKLLESGYRTLTDSDKMGKRFKLFSLFPSVLKKHLEKFPVAGFS